MTPFRRRVVGREVQTHGCAWTDDGRPLAPNAGPAFTVVVPVWNTDPGELRAMYASLCSQRYSAWELSTVDDASTRPETLAALHDIAGDPRVRVTRLDANSGIVGATTAALANARGEWIAFVDHDDTLHPAALSDVARLVSEVPELQMVYTDQDRLRADGDITDPSFKSAWSPDLLRSTNCIVHLCCYRRSLLDELGGLREGFEGSQDYDLLLRVADAVDAASIGHVARPRYHWRASAGSVAADPTAKPWAYDAALRALSDSLQRRGVRGRVDRHDVLGWYHTRYEIGPLSAAVIVVGERGGLQEETLAAVRRVSPGSVPITETFETHTLGTAAAVAAQASSDLVVFVSAGVIVEHGWVDALAEHAQRAEVGLVGGTVVSNNGTPTFGLIVGVGEEGVAAATPSIAPDDFSWSGRVVRNVSAVPLLLAATRPEVVRSLRWDDDLDGHLFAADLALRARDIGLQIVSTPHARGLSAGEAVSRRSAASVRRFRARWNLNDRADPFLNPNLVPDVLRDVAPSGRLRRAIDRVKVRARRSRR